MNRAALYHRVSTVDQNPALAREELRAAAARNGYEIGLEVEETGSGARHDRPGLIRVMEAARRGQIDAVYVWKLDRWGRSVLDVLTNIEELRAIGVRFVALTQSIDVDPKGSNPAGMFALRVLAAASEFERDLIRERTRLGMAHAKSKGSKIGRPPLAITPELVDRVKAMRAEGMTWDGIVEAIGCTIWGARKAAAAVGLRKGDQKSPVEVGGENPSGGK